MIIGIKLGSATLVNGDGKINEEFILSVCQQITFLLRKGHNLFLVSSGAIASAPYPEFSDSLRAVVGQSNLISKYKKFFNVFGIKSGQLLLTDYDFKNPFILKRNLREAFDHGVILVMNANDGVWNGEIKALQKCADNDVLFGDVCGLIRPDLAIIGTIEDGLLDFKNNVVLKVAKENFLQALGYTTNGKNDFGKGGMKSKVKVAHELANMGIRTVLAPAREPNFILRAVNGEENFGTTFI